MKQIYLLNAFTCGMLPPTAPYDAMSLVFTIITPVTIKNLLLSNEVINRYAHERSYLEFLRLMGIAPIDLPPPIRAGVILHTGDSAIIAHRAFYRKENSYGSWRFYHVENIA